MIGLARGPLGLLVAVVAVVLQVLFCIALARLVTTSMARMLRSRRGKELAVFLVIPIFALIELLGQVIPNAAAHGGITAASFAGVDAWLRWLPPGLAAHAIQDASHGHPGTALARLALLAAIIIVLGWGWIGSLSRALVTADTSTGSSQLRGTALPLARYGLRGAVAARFWIYQRREPISLVFWAMTAIIMAVASASTILGPHQHPGIVIASAVLGAGFVGYFHANSVGLTGPPFVIEALALTSRRSLRTLFLRPEHRAQRDLRAAARRDVLRPGRRGQAASGGRIGCRGRPGRPGRSPGPQQHPHRHPCLPDGHANRQPNAPGRPRIRVLHLRRHPRHPGRRRHRGHPERARWTIERSDAFDIAKVLVQPLTSS
jgi:hypothetical protein